LPGPPIRQKFFSGFGGKWVRVRKGND